MRVFFLWVGKREALRAVRLCGRFSHDTNVEPRLLLQNLTCETWRIDSCILKPKRTVHLFKLLFHIHCTFFLRDFYIKPILVDEVECFLKDYFSVHFKTQVAMVHRKKWCFKKGIHALAGEGNQSMAHLVFRLFRSRMSCPKQHVLGGKKDYQREKNWFCHSKLLEHDKNSFTATLTPRCLKR